MTTNELAAAVKEILNSTSPIVHVPYTEAYDAEFEDIQKRVPDIGKIRQYIDFRPDTDLRKVITELGIDLAQEKRTNTLDPESKFGQ